MLLLKAENYGDFFWPTLVVLFFIALLIGAIAVIRKYLFKADDVEIDPMTGFDIGSMRNLVKQGKMTSEEYEAAKNQIVASAQKITERNKPLNNLAPEKKAGREDPI